MLITVAGEPRTVDDGLTVAQLIRQEKLENPEYVSVSIGDEFVQSGDYALRRLQEGDAVEFMYFMMGGGGYGIQQ